MLIDYKKRFLIVRAAVINYFTKVNNLKRWPIVKDFKFGTP